MLCVYEEFLRSLNILSAVVIKYIIMVVSIKVHCAWELSSILD